MLANRVRMGAGGGGLKTWSDIQQAIRAGKISKHFSVGDQITSIFDGNPLVLDIIDINHDIPTDTNFPNSMTLQAHDVLEERRWHSSNSTPLFPANEAGIYLNDTSSNGFIGKLDPALAAVLGAVDKQVARPAGNGQYLFSAKVFLLSPVEVGFAPEGITTGESVYAFYMHATNTDRIKILNGTNARWWLRSYELHTYYNVRAININGNLASFNPVSSYGFAPALVIV